MRKLLALLTLLLLHVGPAVAATDTYNMLDTTTLINPTLTYNFTDDGNNNYVWRVNPSTAARGPFVMTYQAPLFNGDRDPVIGWGYNMQVGGILIKSGESGLGWNIEGYYNDGSGQPKMEAYLQYVNAAGTLATRPIFFTLNRSTDRVDQIRLKSNAISFIVDDGAFQGEAGNAYMTFANGGLTIAGISAGNTAVTMQAGASRAAVLTWQYNAANAMQMYPASASNGLITQGSTVPVAWYSSLSGDTAPSVNICNNCADNTAALVVQTGSGATTARVTAKFKAKASQTGDIIQATNSSATALWSVDGSGIPTWTSIAEPTCNSSNRGKVTMVQGGAGVADTFRLCSKDAADAYAWRTLL